MDLRDIGWNPLFHECFEPYQARGYVPARVVCGQHEQYRVLGADGELRAEVSGKFRYAAAISADFPVVGDWVAIEPRLSEVRATIHAVLPRQSHISRKAASGADRLSGGITDEQVLAANVETVFIVTGLDRDFNLRRIERYLTQVYSSGAMPVIVLNKADLCDDLDMYLDEVEAIAFGVPVHAVSAQDNRGVDALLDYLATGKTAALLGSSGVGKSTIINRLLGDVRQTVSATSDSTRKGRHTTTHRELFVLPAGGLLIDNPGLRELQLWGEEAQVNDVFVEIEALAAHCRFRDCSHTTEPGCVVRAAVDDGTLAHERWQHYLKLQKEVQFLEQRQTQSARSIERDKWKPIEKWKRAMQKEGRFYK